MPVLQNIAGTWKALTPFVKVNGVWKQAKMWQKVGSVWKDLTTPPVSGGPATFSPDGGTVSDTRPDRATTTLSCSQTATWTYSSPGGVGSASIASGGTGTSITFSVTAVGGSTRSKTWTVNGTSGAVSRDFTVELTAEGTSGGQPL